MGNKIQNSTFLQFNKSKESRCFLQNSFLNELQNVCMILIAKVCWSACLSSLLESSVY